MAKLNYQKLQYDKKHADNLRTYRDPDLSRVHRKRHSKLTDKQFKFLLVLLRKSEFKSLKEAIGGLNITYNYKNRGLENMFPLPKDVAESLISALIEITK